MVESDFVSISHNKNNKNKTNPNLKKKTKETLVKLNKAIFVLLLLSVKFM